MPSPKSAYTGQHVHGANVAGRATEAAKAPNNRPTLEQCIRLHLAGHTAALDLWCTVNDQPLDVWQYYAEHQDEMTLAEAYTYADAVRFR